MCMKPELGFPAVQQGSMDIKPHGWVQSRPSQCLPHSLWDFLYWISQDATIVNGPTLVIHKKANETPYSVIIACTHSEDSKWIKLFPQKKCQQARIYYSDYCPEIHDIIELHSLIYWAPSVNSNDAIFYFLTSPPPVQRKQWVRQKQMTRSTQTGHYWSLNEFITVK